MRMPFAVALALLLVTICAGAPASRPRSFRSLSDTRMAYALALAFVVGGCARPSPMVVANKYDVPLVVRVGTASAAIDFAVPANARRDLESPANVESVVVFNQECETMSIIVLEPGTPTFEAGGLITMDPVGLGDFVAGASPSSGILAERSDRCDGVPTPAPAPS